MRIPNLGDSRKKKNERVGAQRWRSGSRRPGVGLPWCSRVPIAVAGTVAASLGWLRRCDEGASRAGEKTRRGRFGELGSRRRCFRCWLASTAARLTGRGTCGSGTCGWSLGGSVARDFGEGAAVKRGLAN